MSMLLAVAEAGSLSAASRQLGIPLATVSRKVSDLEAHLRVRLFDRTSRRLELTEVGRSYVAASKRILEDVNEAERTASGEYVTPRGDVIITAPIVLGRLHVLPVSAEFLAAYPEINVRLLLSDRILNLLEDHVDLAVRVAALPDSGLTAVRLGEIRRVVCGSPNYFEKRGKPHSPADLASHDCITFEGLDSLNSWRFPTAKNVNACRTSSTVGRQYCGGRY